MRANEGVLFKGTKFVVIRYRVTDTDTRGLGFCSVSAGRSVTGHPRISFATFYPTPAHTCHHRSGPSLGW